jgi:hypothetical protein
MAQGTTKVLDEVGKKLNDSLKKLEEATEPLKQTKIHTKRSTKQSNRPKSLIESFAGQSKVSSFFDISARENRGSGRKSGKRREREEDGNMDEYDFDDGFVVPDGPEGEEDEEYEDRDGYSDEDEDDDASDFREGRDYEDGSDEEEDEEEEEDDYDISDDDQAEEANDEERDEQREVHQMEEKMIIGDVEKNTSSQIGRSVRMTNKVEFEPWAKRFVLIFMDQWGKTKENMHTGRYIRAFENMNISNGEKPGRGSKDRGRMTTDEIIDMYVLKIYVRLPVVLADALIQTTNKDEDELYMALVSLQSYEASKVDDPTIKCPHCQNKATDRILMRCIKINAENRHDEDKWESTFVMCEDVLKQVKMVMFFRLMHFALRERVMKALVPTCDLTKKFNQKKYQEGIEKNGSKVHRDTSDYIIKICNTWVKSALQGSTSLELPTTIVV